MILVGTDDGFQAVGTDIPPRPSGHSMTAVHQAPDAIWAISSGAQLWLDPTEEDARVVATIDEGQANCVLSTPAGVVVGASEARLFRLKGEELALDEAFMTAEGRDSWHTPWGGPPDVRSMDVDDDGTVYLNVHVGGVLRSRDGRVWQPTMDISADVHQVVARRGHPGTAYAASAIGLGITTNGAESWSFEMAGLHASYCRAVAVGDDYLLISASQGPGGRKAAVFRRPIDLSTPFEQCRVGLPEWFPTNIDTFRLAARGRVAAVGSSDGSVYSSEDGGDTWTVAAEGLPGIHCVLIT